MVADSLCKEAEMRAGRISASAGANEPGRDDGAAMRLAIEQAQQAWKIDEVPVGAIVVDAEGTVIGQGFNRTITDHDPTAHAEIVALRQAAQRVENYRLPGATLFVTLEPCVMCMGAMLHARLARVVYGATDPKTGACGSVARIQDIARLNHQTIVEGGVLESECGELLRAFFRHKRAVAKAARKPAAGDTSVKSSDVPQR